MATVTADNFGDVLPRVLEDIAAADFVAIDGEFTGLHRQEALKPNGLDTIDARFCKLRDSAKHFALLQYGLTPFVFDEKRDMYMATPYSFHLYPVTDFGGMEPTFMVQASSVKFLSSNSFDFNKTFAKGIPFLSRSQAEELLSKRQQKKAAQQGRPGNPVDMTKARSDDVQWRDGLQRQLMHWQNGVEEEAAAKAAAREDSVDREEGETSDDEEPLDADILPHVVLPPCNTYRIRIAMDLLDNMPSLVGTFVDSDVPADGNPFWKTLRVVYVQTPERKAAWAAKNAKDRTTAFMSEVDSYKGFRALIDALSAARCPVVGHNCMLDLLHTTQKFVGDIPDLDSWVDQLADLFPVVFDTKHVVGGLRNHVKETSLRKAYDAVLAVDSVPRMGGLPPAVPPGVEMVTSESGSNAASVEHDSGFDAYMTGVLFYRSLFLLGFERDTLCALKAQGAQSSSSSSDDDEAGAGAGAEEAEPEPVLDSAKDQLLRLSNVFPLGRMWPRVWALKQAPHRKQGSFRNVVYIIGLTSAVTTDDVVHMIIAALPDDARVDFSNLRRNVNWVDGTSVLVKLSSPKLAKDLVVSYSRWLPADGDAEAGAGAGAEAAPAEPPSSSWAEGRMPSLDAFTVLPFEEFLAQFEEVFGDACDWQIGDLEDSDVDDDGKPLSRKRIRDPQAEAEAAGEVPSGKKAAKGGYCAIM